VGGTLGGKSGGRLILALGDMLELGSGAAALHAGLADSLQANKVDLVFTAGAPAAVAFTAVYAVAAFFTVPGTIFMRGGGFAFAGIGTTPQDPAPPLIILFFKNAIAPGSFAYFFATS
jgi:hypothetical protein